MDDSIRTRAKAYADAKTKNLEGYKRTESWWIWFDAYIEIAEEQEKIDEAR